MAFSSYQDFMLYSGFRLMQQPIIRQQLNLGTFSGKNGIFIKTHSQDDGSSQLWLN